MCWTGPEGPVFLRLRLQFCGCGCGFAAAAAVVTVFWLLWLLLLFSGCCGCCCFTAAIALGTGGSFSFLYTTIFYRNFLLPISCMFLIYISIVVRYRSSKSLVCAQPKRLLQYFDRYLSILRFQVVYR
jgi:hypothetical protein